MDIKDIKEVLEKHKRWIGGEEGGERADLRGADLRGADLRGADLRGADLRGAAGNRRQIKSIFVSNKWLITYTAEYLQIGCQRHEISEWREFSDEEISEMDSGALEFWREMKDFILSTIERFPAEKTGAESK